MDVLPLLLLSEQQSGAKGGFQQRISPETWDLHPGPLLITAHQGEQENLFSVLLLPRSAEQLWDESPLTTQAERLRGPLG